MSVVDAGRSARGAAEQQMLGHGPSLIWGTVRWDGLDVDLACMDRFTCAVRNHASLGAVKTRISGSVVFCSARLWPAGMGEGDQAADQAESDGAFFAADACFYDGTDSKLLECALAAADPRVLAEANGDFAAVLWDPKHRALLLCRDAVGARPLFLTIKPGVEASFCSLMLPLAEAGFASGDKNPWAAAEMAVADFSGTNTVLAGIQRVPAGHTGRVTSDGVRFRRYWIPNPGPEIQGDAATLATRLRNTLNLAVARRLPRSGPAATQCSGGLDSSAVTALAAGQMAAEGRTVLACFCAGARRADLDQIDGTPFVSALSQHFPTLEVHSTSLPDAGVLLTSNLRADLPFAPNTDFGLAEAGARGIPIVLSGLGGDETASYSGRGAVEQLLFRRQIRRALALSHEHARRTGRSRASVLRQALARLFLPRWLSRRRAQRSGPSRGADRMALYLTSAARRAVEPSIEPRQTDAIRRKKLTDGHLAYNAEAMAILGAKHGVAVAYPFLDKDVISLCQRLPVDLFCREGLVRWPLRAAMAGLLPEMVRTRDKKIPTSNSHCLSLSENKRELHDRLRALRSTDAAEVFNVPVLEDALTRLPSACDSLSDARAHAKSGDIPDMRGADFVLPHLLLRLGATSDRTQGRD